MEWYNIDFVRKIWHIPKTKNGKAQNVPLTDEIIEILQARKLTSKSKLVLPNDRTKSGHLEYPYKGWYKICKKAGIKNLRIHDLRRTFASCIADEGPGQYIIGTALNHSDIKSTSIYTKVSSEPVRQYMSKVTQIIREHSGIDI
ncbi:phage integrase family protein [Orientia tsutsugamushi str. UT76]|nr:phage integrase family protein [Orientia tsutsugamushi str. UT76]